METSEFGLLFTITRKEKPWEIGGSVGTAGQIYFQTRTFSIDFKNQQGCALSNSDRERISKIMNSCGRQPVTCNRHGRSAL